ncbi:MAG TPA: SirB2 family protein [Pseudomonadales bacterium]|nr:SirB2 family protein [Pseudomonadales bacterium]
MTAFPLILAIHVLSALVSICFFILRGIWMMMESRLLQKKFVRIAPHVIDTLLLASAIVLTILIGQYPFVNGWLTVKLIALIVYIGLGVVALRAGKTKGVRIVAFVAAILVFGFIVSVALTHNPLGVFAGVA